MIYVASRTNPGTGAEEVLTVSTQHAPVARFVEIYNLNREEGTAYLATLPDEMDRTVENG
jgi:hypothetical protein